MGIRGKVETRLVVVSVIYKLLRITIFLGLLIKWLSINFFLIYLSQSHPLLGIKVAGNLGVITASVTIFLYTFFSIFYKSHLIRV